MGLPFHLPFSPSLPQSPGSNLLTLASDAVSRPILLLTHALDAHFALIWGGGGGGDSSSNSCCRLHLYQLLLS